MQWAQRTVAAVAKARTGSVEAVGDPDRVLPNVEVWLRVDLIRHSPWRRL